MLRIVRQPLAEANPESLRRVPALLKLRVLRFGFFQDGDVRVGVFPEGKKIFVSRERPTAGGISIRTMRASRLQRIGASHSQVR